MHSPRSSQVEELTVGPELRERLQESIEEDLEVLLLSIASVEAEVRQVQEEALDLEDRAQGEEVWRSLGEDRARLAELRDAVCGLRKQAMELQAEQGKDLAVGPELRQRLLELLESDVESLLLGLAAVQQEIVEREAEAAGLYDDAEAEAARLEVEQDRVWMEEMRGAVVRLRAQAAELASEVE